MTPTGGGQRSLNVRLRQKLDLYVCQRPIKWFEGVPSPVITPQAVNMIVFAKILKIYILELNGHMTQVM